MSEAPITEIKCPECYVSIWQNLEMPYLICPHCGARLPKLNQFSSEDANEGVFKEIQNENTQNYLFRNPAFDVDSVSDTCNTGSGNCISTFRIA